MKGALYLHKLFSILVFKSGNSLLFCLLQAFICGQFKFPSVVSEVFQVLLGAYSCISL